MKTATSFTFSLEDKQLLTILAKRMGIGRSGVIETLTRADARRTGVSVNHRQTPDSSQYPRQAKQANTKPFASTFHLSEDAHALLNGLSVHYGMTKTMVLCRLFKEHAYQEGILPPPVTTSPPT